MAKGNVKKGFATYLLILFIAIIAAFFIIVSIMLFSPFKNILGFKYFVYKNTQIVQKISDGDNKYSFDYANIKKISIDCNFANVAVERSSKYDDCTILLENKSSGIARSDQNTDFICDVAYEDEARTKISIKLREPEGFLYFSKNITIILIAPAKNDISFDNTEVDITNTKGTISIGTANPVVGSNSPSYEDKNDPHNFVSFKKLNIKSTNNKIIFFEYAKASEDIFIKTRNGSVEIRNKLNADKFHLYASKAKLNFRDVEIENAMFDLGDSDFNSSSFKVTNLDLMIKNGHITINELNGTLSSNNMTYEMNKPTINIKKVNGNVSIPNAGKAEVQIDEVATNSQVYLRNTSGKISIGNVKNDCYLLLETGSGEINATVNGASKVDLRSGSGKINLSYFAGILSSGIKLTNFTGETNVTLKHDSSFTLEVRDTDGNMRTSNNVNVQGYDGDFVIPLNVNGGGNKLNIIANKKVNVSFA